MHNVKVESVKKNADNSIGTFLQTIEIIVRNKINMIVNFSDEEVHVYMPYTRILLKVCEKMKFSSIVVLPNLKPLWRFF